MAVVKLIGSNDLTSNINTAENYLFISKFTAVGNGTISQFRIKVNTNCNIKSGIYTDNSGSASVLLNSVGSTACTTGWNTISFPDTTIYKDTVYWLALNSDTSACIATNSTGGVEGYKALAFANAFPNPAGTGFSANEGWLVANAGWGITGLGGVFLLHLI